MDADPDIDERDVVTALREAAAAAARTPSGDGATFAFPSTTSAMAILRRAWVSRNGDDAEGFMDIDTGSWIDTLCEYLDASPAPIVTCWNPSSMASGMWGLGTFSDGHRGYIYSFPDDRYGGFDDENPLYGGWEPVGSESAARESFIQVYRTVWDEVGLPPWFGEAANGPTGWMTDAILGFEGPLSVYVAAPSDDLLTRMVEEADAGTVAAELNVPVDLVDSLLSELESTGLPDESELEGDRGRAFLACSLRAVGWR